MMTHAQSDRAQFVVRDKCIACHSPDCITLDRGSFSTGLVRRFLDEDPWGVSPFPSLDDADWEFVKCERCGQMFHKHILTNEWNNIRFRDWMSESAMREFDRQRGLDTPRYHFEKARLAAEHVLRVERLTRRLRGENAIRLADIGCGWGEFVSLAAEFGIQACGIERSPDRQRFMRDRGLTVFEDLKSAREALPEGVHVATMFQVLEHLDHPLEMLLEIHELMLPDGILVLEVPNCEGTVGIKSRSDYHNIHPLEHINAFTPQTLTQIAARAGFRAISSPIVQVTADFKRVVKREIRRVASLIMKPGTHQYFRKVERV
jgi:2-polyprenyl-3-methyl-5-hydroxy-6-metoxy-1,4-benzoquinol methylase